MLWFHMPSSLPGFAVRKHRLSYGSNKVEKYSACRNQVVVSATEVECLCRFMSLVCLEELLVCGARPVEDHLAQTAQVEPL